MYDFTAQQLGLRLAALILLIAVQGGAIASAAVALGDKGPQHDERCTLNPLAHLDLLGLVSGLLFSIPWIKPVAIDPVLLKGGRAALLLILLAGFAATIGLVLLLDVLRLALLPHLPDSVAQTLFAFVAVAGSLGLWFAVANLLPCLPFAGALLLTALWPQRRLARLQLAAGLVMLALAGSGVMGSLLGTAQDLLAGIVLRQ